MSKSELVKSEILYDDMKICESILEEIQELSSSRIFSGCNVTNDGVTEYVVYLDNVSVIDENTGLNISSTGYGKTLLESYKDLIDKYLDRTHRVRISKTNVSITRSVRRIILSSDLPFRIDFTTEKKEEE